VALVTDGRFSGATRGICVGHVAPEAARCGPIALVEENDKIVIDLIGRRIDIDVDESDLAERRRKWSPSRKELKGYLKRYASQVTSAANGAVLGGSS